MAIVRNEILKGQTCPPELEENLTKFLKAMNEIRSAYGKPMIVSSGYRSRDRQIEIYANKACKKEFPFEDGVFVMSKVPLGSSHLYCTACDISDPNKELQKWVKKNEKLLEKAGLYCEDFAYTPTWVHFQITKPKSGKRFFIP